MPDYLAIICEVISQHQYIRQNVKLVGDSVSDMEALFSLQKAHSGWAQSSIEALSERLRQLEQVIKRLDEGLKKHFHFEEKALPPILGEILLKALVLEHRNIGKEMGNTRVILSDTKLEGLTQEELLSKKAYLQQMISKISQVVEAHTSEEELILRTIKRALEAEA